MTHFLRFGDTYRLAASNAINIADKLPAATYSLKRDKEGFYLDIIDNFELPSKLYGDCTRNTDRIINTFWERPNSTGVFLEGEKGSGKTLLSKAVCSQLLTVDVPSIVINEPHFGEEFNTFVQSIHQPAVIVFDEFEKIYTDTASEFNGGVNAQERVLTLFDGVYPTKKLFIVTCNDSWRIDKNLKNRPGRMYYMLSFRGLDENFIREYAEENLIDKTRVDSIISTACMFDSFNFDMLKALIEEMNRYNESAADSIKLLNTKPSSGTSTFSLQLTVDGETKTLTRGYDEWEGNPLSSDVNVNVMNAEGNRYTLYKFKQEELQKVDGASGTFVYVNADSDKLVMKRKTYNVVDWTKYATC